MSFFANLFGRSATNTHVSTPEHTGVSRYLDGQPSTALSGVAKYLQTQEQHQSSSVAKYLARQAIAEKNKPIVRLTGVAKYLASQDQTPTSGVTKYMLQKAIAERNAPAKARTTRVESYLQSLPTKTKTSGVSKYFEKQTLAVVNQENTVVDVETMASGVELTGVEKYLQGQR